VLLYLPTREMCAGTNTEFAHAGIVASIVIQKSDTFYVSRSIP